MDTSTTVSFLVSSMWMGGLWRIGLVAVEVLHEGVDAPGVQEVVALAVALVRDADVDALVEVAQLPQALAEDLEGEVQHVVEDLSVGLEADAGAAPGRGTDRGQGRIGLAPGEGHGVLLPVPPDGQPEPLGEGVHAGDAHAMEAAGDLVGVVVELPARMEHGHDHFGGAAVLLLVQVRGDAAAVVLHGAAAIVVEVHVHTGAVAGEGLVHRVVHHLVDHLVEAVAIVRVADVHPGPLADGFEVPQYGDVVCGVGVGRFLLRLDGCF